MSYNKQRPKMPQAQRAKQFMPFSALRGHENMSKEQAKHRELRRELTPHRRHHINQMLSWLRKGDLLTITSFEQDSYITVTGTLLEIEPVFKWLRLKENGLEHCISFEDIWWIKNV